MEKLLVLIAIAFFGETMLARACSLVYYPPLARGFHLPCTREYLDLFIIRRHSHTARSVDGKRTDYQGGDG